MNTMEHYFWLDRSRPNKDGKVNIMGRVIVNGDRKNFPTGYKVHPDKWDENKKAVKGKDVDAARINRHIMRTTLKVQKEYDKLIDQDLPVSAEILKNIVTGKGIVNATVLEILKEHNEHFLQMLGRKGYSPATYKKYPIFQEKLERYLKTLNRKDMFLQEIDYNFLHSFKNYMLLHGQTKKGTDGKHLPMDLNSVIGNLKKLKKIMGTAKKRGLIKTDPFDGLDMSWDDKEVAYLEMEHVEKLLAFKFNSKRLDVVRDRFIVGCFTGMAHSDISKANRDNLVRDMNGSYRLMVNRTKTGEPAYIPVLKEVQDIIDKYRGANGDLLFPQISLQKTNAYLKEIADIVGIPVHMTSHTARHTAGQMLSDMGVDIEVIAAILGHANSNTTKKHYAKVSSRLINDEMEQFKKKREKEIIDFRLKIAK